MGSPQVQRGPHETSRWTLISNIQDLDMSEECQRSRDVNTVLVTGDGRIIVINSGVGDGSREAFEFIFYPAAAGANYVVHYPRDRGF